MPLLRSLGIVLFRNYNHGAPTELGHRLDMFAKRRLRLSRLSEIEAAHCAGAGGEFVGFEAHALEGTDEEVWQRVIAICIEGKVLAVFETAAGKDGGEVRGDVGVGVAEV